MYHGGGEGTASLGAIHSGCPHQRGDGADHQRRGPPDPSRRQWRRATGRAAGQRSPCQPSPSGGGGGGEDEVHGFLFPGYSLRLRKPEQKVGTNGRVTNHCRPPFRVYKGPGENRSKTSPELAAKFKTRRKSDLPVPRTARTRNGRHANRSSRRINSPTEQATPLAGEAGVASPSP
jgi:hypothetical protein